MEVSFAVQLHIHVAPECPRQRDLEDIRNVHVGGDFDLRILRTGISRRDHLGLQREASDLQIDRSVDGEGAIGLEEPIEMHVECAAQRDATVELGTRRTRLDRHT